MFHIAFISQNLRQTVGEERGAGSSSTPGRVDLG
jgi:hypothetical protein